MILSLQKRSDHTRSFHGRPHVQNRLRSVILAEHSVTWALVLVRHGVEGVGILYVYEDNGGVSWFCSGRMKVLVYGAGGVGGLLGLKLIHGGCHVTFVARNANLEAIRARGLVLREMWEGGKEECVRVEAVRNVGELVDFEPDVVLMCVKNYDLEQAAKDCAGLTTGVIVPMLNGVDSYNVISTYVDPSRVAAGICRVVAFVAEPGVVVVQSPNNSVEFGEWIGEPKSDRLVALKEKFIAGGVHAVIPKDTKVCIWTKMVQMGSLGPVCAVARASMREVVTIPETAELFVSAMREIIEIAAKQGIIVPATLPESAVTNLAK